MADGTRSLVVRVWLPDRPGALGAVASRIGGVGGDVHEIEVVDHGAGRAVDEFLVTVPEAVTDDLLAREIEDVDGVDVEELRAVDFVERDPRIDALETAVALSEAADVPARLVALAEQVRHELRARWVAVIGPDGIEALVGDGPTHNHFVVDNGGKVFNRSAQIIKLSAQASETDYHGLTGLLNSSLACFWFKQVCHNKGSTVDQRGARQRTDAFEDFYEYAGTVAGRFPTVSERPTGLARRIHQLALERGQLLPDQIIAGGVPTQTHLTNSKSSAELLRRQMIALQEELDWQVYKLYGMAREELCFDGEPPPIHLGERAFEIVLAQDCARGSTTTTWFVRHSALPVTELPTHWPAW